MKLKALGDFYIIKVDEPNKIGKIFIPYTDSKETPKYPQTGIDVSTGKKVAFVKGVGLPFVYDETQYIKIHKKFVQLEADDWEGVSFGEDDVERKLNSIDRFNNAITTSKDASMLHETRERAKDSFNKLTGRIVSGPGR